MIKNRQNWEHKTSVENDRQIELTLNIMLNFWVNISPNPTSLLHITVFLLKKDSVATLSTWIHQLLTSF